MIYLDNAATTPVAPQVVDAMLPFLTEHFGNPSSTHAFGRKTRAAIEKVRKQIADTFKASASEFIFTSGGTEADNIAIQTAVKQLGVTHIITSPIEHHAVLHTVKSCSPEVKISLVNLNEIGEVDVTHLEELIQEGEKTLVSLMHANNEIGNVIDLAKIGKLCKEKGAYFHSDTVQTIGHLPIDLSELEIDFITCAAHKLHGPKGVGFLYIRSGIVPEVLIHGGAQERERRGGTENVAGIIGLGKAIELACEDIEGHKKYVLGLKNHMKALLSEKIPGVAFNGKCSDNCLYTVLNVNFPKHKAGSMLLFQLDMAGIACSGGSACSSGSTKGSHVLAELTPVNKEGINIRFSFSRFTKKEDIEKAVDVVAKVYQAEKLQQA